MQLDEHFLDQPVSTCSSLYTERQQSCKLYRIASPDTEDRFDNERETSKINTL